MTENYILDYANNVSIQHVDGLKLSNDAIERMRIEFYGRLDHDFFTPHDWETRGFKKHIDNLSSPPIVFEPLDKSRVETYMKLYLKKQPPPGFVGQSLAPLPPLLIELHLHPEFDGKLEFEWKVGRMHVECINLNDFYTNQSNYARRRKTNPKSTLILAKLDDPNKLSIGNNVIGSFDFDGRELLLEHLILGSTGGHTKQIRFSCDIQINNEPPVTLFVLSNPLYMKTNCNQWSRAFSITLKHALVPNSHMRQISFQRFFNILHLFHFSTSLTKNHRYLTPDQVFQWLFDMMQSVTWKIDHCASKTQYIDNLLRHELQIDVFLVFFWVEMSSSLFYSLQRNSTGKFVQHLWTFGYLGIGWHPEQFILSTCDILHSTTSDESLSFSSSNVGLYNVEKKMISPCELNHRVQKNVCSLCYFLNQQEKSQCVIDTLGEKRMRWMTLSIHSKAFGSQNASARTASMVNQSKSNKPCPSHEFGKFDHLRFIVENEIARDMITTAKKAKKQHEYIVDHSSIMDNSTSTNNNNDHMNDLSTRSKNTIHNMTSITNTSKHSSLIHHSKFDKNNVTNVYRTCESKSNIHFFLKKGQCCFYLDIQNDAELCTTHGIVYDMPMVMRHWNGTLHTLTSFEKDHFAYFLMHARATEGCDQIVSLSDPNQCIFIRELSNL